MNASLPSESLFSLSTKVALVTGGGSGIGRQMALSLAKAGASVVLTARRENMLMQTVQTISEFKGSSAFLTADLSKTASIPGLVEKAQKLFGSVDILVNAAGVNLRESAEEITPDSWEQTLSINLKTPFFLAQSLVPQMRKKGWGKIINISSLQSKRAFKNGLAYGASKGGVDQMTRAMAEAWSKDGICCNAIAPGFFPTEMTSPVYEDHQLVEHNATQTAIGRNGELRDLEGITVFLASSASDYITGQTIFVDGGFTAK
ncbi:MAG: SDR family oxidoreductase [Deltaproteobacteria bacterium]|jgi:NAD(P)-dependent dehydrogenase (short-subunit alcohol dehydrogenase family)|nr:SDR family oxidoreductase [Deltaproteobacteria bacterium]